MHASNPNNSDGGMDRLHASFIQILLSVASAQYRKPDLELTAFFPVAGERCRGQLMVVGRAVNGWTDQPFRAGECLDIERQREILRQSAAIIAKDHARPLSWVVDRWGLQGPGEYATRRSAFWRVVRSLCHSLIPDAAGDQWPSYVVWSNLYKVSPWAGGNPSNALCSAQEAQCVSLLKEEITHWKPRYLVFLTGNNWADPFIRFLKPIDSRPTEGFVQASGAIAMSADRDVGSFVVGPHPQGKPEGKLVESLIAALRQ